VYSYKDRAWICVYLPSLHETLPRLESGTSIQSTTHLSQVLKWK